MSKPYIEQWAVEQHIKKNPKCEWLCTHSNQENLGETQPTQDPKGLTGNLYGIAINHSSNVGDPRKHTEDDCWCWEENFPTTPATKPLDELVKTKADWSTPYDEWLIPILNRFRYGGAIECRAIPSEIQLHIKALITNELRGMKIAGLNLDKITTDHADGYQMAVDDMNQHLDDRIKELENL